MQVKIGNRWYKTHEDGPICIALTETEKENIGKMPKGIHRYSIFDMPDCHELYDRANECAECDEAVEKHKAWMEEGWDGWEANSTKDEEKEAE